MNKSAAKRLSRIRRRAIPQVQEALSQGLISARRADILLYLPPFQQQASLEALQAQARRYSRAAGAITDYLRNLPLSSQPRLDQLAHAIQNALTTDHDAAATCLRTPSIPTQAPTASP